MEPSDALVPKLPVHNTNTCGSRRKTKHEKLNSCGSFAIYKGFVSVPDKLGVVHSHQLLPAASRKSWMAKWLCVMFQQKPA